MGFTTGSKPHIPVITGGRYGYQHINAAKPRRHPESLLNWTERIIRMRHERKCRRSAGAFDIIPSGDRRVLIMRYDPGSVNNKL